MEKDEKEVKRTTKKTTATKKTPAKKSTSAKKEPAKKTTKKVVKKEVVKPVVKEEEKVAIKKEKEVAVENKEEKVIVSSKKTKKEVSKELLEVRKKRYIIEAIIIGIVVIIALVFLCNKTFLKTSYKNDAINVSLPRFSYYVKDKDNVVKFYTLRKSKNLKEYYNEYLEGFIFYSCAEGNNTFYYNDETKTLIKDIQVNKKFAVKTVEITYDTRTPEEVCGLR